MARWQIGARKSEATKQTKDQSNNKTTKTKWEEGVVGYKANNKSNII